MTAASAFWRGSVCQLLSPAASNAEAWTPLICHNPNDPPEGSFGLTLVASPPLSACAMAAASGA